MEGSTLERLNAIRKKAFRGTFQERSCTMGDTMNSKSKNKMCGAELCRVRSTGKIWRGLQMRDVCHKMSVSGFVGTKNQKVRLLKSNIVCTKVMKRNREGSKGHMIYQNWTQPKSFGLRLGIMQERWESAWESDWNIVCVESPFLWCGSKLKLEDHRKEKKCNYMKGEDVFQRSVQHVSVLLISAPGRDWKQICTNQRFWGGWKGAVG